jgi:hypothetical protein
MSSNNPTKDEAIEVEEGRAMKDPSSTTTVNHRSSHGGSMASSILRFNDINFVVGKGDKQRNILEGITGKVKWGRKLKHNKLTSLPLPP